MTCSSPDPALHSPGPALRGHGRPAGQPRRALDRQFKRFGLSSPFALSAAVPRAPCRCDRSPVAVPPVLHTTRARTVGRFADVARPLGVDGRSAGGPAVGIVACSSRALRGVTFEWRDESMRDSRPRVAGVIAQEVERVVPGSGPRGEGGLKLVDYTALQAALIEALVELADRVKVALGPTRSRPHVRARARAVALGCGLTARAA